MSIRPQIPYGSPVPNNPDYVPIGIPVDAAGNSLIPELAGRSPTHNESELISAETITMASSNVKEIHWNWKEPALFVRFLDGSLYVYHNVPLSIAVGMVVTASPGRYVWNVLRVGWPTSTGAAERLIKGPSRAGRGRPKPQVVRMVR